MRLQRDTERPRFKSDETGHRSSLPVGFFTDAVFAIAMTLLVIDIPKPEGGAEHHQLLDRVDRLSPGLIRLHFPLLLLVGFVPYATTVYDHNTFNPAAAGFFTVVVAALLVVRSAVQSRALSDGLLRDDVDRDAYRKDARTSWIVAWYFLATVTLCWFTPWLTFLWFGAPVVGSIVGRRPTTLRP